MGRQLLVVLCCLGFAFRADAESLDGAVECPCLRQDDPRFATMSAQFQANGYPADYGFGGCKAWDVGLNQTSCEGAATDVPGHCESKWCYVDPLSCQRQEEECISQQLLLNDPTHPACRSRPFLSSTLHPDFTLHYSYETCGYLNNYEVENVFGGMRNTALIGAADHDLPYVSVSEIESELGEKQTVYSGVEYSFIESTLGYFDFDVDLRMIDGFATASSRERFTSSYTACVHDVAVGNFDICIGDFWVTPERMLMTQFLPSMRSDQFYLVVFEDSTLVDFKEFLQNPFKPFSNEAWGLIAAVVVLKALSMALLDWSPEEDCHTPHTPRRYLHRTWKAFFLAWVSVFSGKAHYQSKSLPAQVSTMGFQVFLLVVVASYKAKLASMLIVRNIGSGIQDINHAIDERLTICIPAAIETTVKLNYQTGEYYVYSGSSADFARHMHAGHCKAAIIHQKRIDQLHAGRINEADCKKVQSGEMTEEEGRCETSHYVGERDDCQIIKVGEIILSVPIAFPIYKGGNLVTPLSVAVTKAQNAGEWEASIKSNAHLFPQSICEATFADGRLGMDAFAGVSFIVGLGVALGLAIRFCQHHQRARSKQSGGSPSPELPASEASSSAQPKVILDKLAEVTQLVQQLQAAQGHDFQVQCDSGMVINGGYRPTGESFSITSPRMAETPKPPSGVNGHTNRHTNGNGDEGAGLLFRGKA